MFNNKGSTLIESLFAFEIYIGIIIVLITLITTINKSYLRIKDDYQFIHQKEGEILYKENFSEIVKMVLH